MSDGCLSFNLSLAIDVIVAGGMLEEVVLETFATGLARNALEETISGVVVTRLTGDTSEEIVMCLSGGLVLAACTRLALSSSRMNTPVAALSHAGLYGCEC